MQLVPGVTLEERWDSLSETEKVEICTQLRNIFKKLRCWEQPTKVPFVGNVIGGPSHDYIFTEAARRPAGPFKSISEMHDFLSALPHTYDPSEPHPLRHMLIDNGRLTFTHGDLHRLNVIVSPAGAHVAAIIDWTQAGWMPEHWEYAKAQAMVWRGTDWRDKFLHRILEGFEDESDEIIGYEFFTIRLGV